MKPSATQPRSIRAGLAMPACAAVLAFVAAPLQAQDDKYPEQPIRVVVPFGVGGLADISLRLVTQRLAERLGQQVVVENKPGAGGVVAANAVLAAPRDGYTLAVFANGTAISKTLFKLPYDPEADFAPISTVAYFDLVLLTRAKGPLQSLPALLAEGKRRQLVLGTINPGSTQNLSAELFKSMAGTNAMIVPFKSTPEVLTALLRGDVDVMFESYAALKGAITAGQATPIAATGKSRSSWLPDVPTVAESGVPDYEVTGWNALFAPAGTPPARIARLNAAVNEVLREPAIRRRLQELGTQAQGSTTGELAAVFKRDIDKWADVIRKAGIPMQQN
ncbi:MAG: tripartite tricarboxylate transporter substrate-binding protein [Pigmentiphaga sp.]|uniref:Bug family tripartite tricarboxylate transporter substrate binding protein n=1 Tax=Pigmentiphaga sp. TaxID=1977564 RepID=UPI0029A84813|nr:tripartite tricarboxylate transporter substrate-binding protein [Pigmentiphaga sp.]MDX3907077.1 tripartite tricarboxylate transporter substrate-binding protein [Pigmentiphaga sp.]